MDCKHKILIVDDEKSVGMFIGRLLEMEGIEYVYVENATKALKEMKSTTAPFSLIIADQQMPGIKGTDFLEYAKVMSPDSIRFLLTVYYDIDTIAEAVNKGSVHKYINKPWDNKDFLILVKNALKQFEVHLENERPLMTAERQNKKLFKLNEELEETIGKYENDLIVLDKAIGAIKTQQHAKASPSDVDPGRIMQKMKAAFIEEGRLDADRLSAFYTDIIKTLYTEFEALANQNGFKMPEI